MKVDQFKVIKQASMAIESSVSESVFICDSLVTTRIAARLL